MSCFVTCPNCLSEYEVEESVLGERMRCRECKHSFRLERSPEEAVRMRPAGKLPDYLALRICAVALMAVGGLAVLGGLMAMADGRERIDRHEGMLVTVVGAFLILGGFLVRSFRDVARNSWRRKDGHGPS